MNSFRQQQLLQHPEPSAKHVVQGPTMLAINVNVAVKVKVKLKLDKVFVQVVYEEHIPILKDYQHVYNARLGKL